MELIQNHSIRSFGCRRLAFSARAAPHAPRDLQLSQQPPAPERKQRTAHAHLIADASKCILEHLKQMFDSLGERSVRVGEVDVSVGSEQRVQMSRNQLLFELRRLLRQSHWSQTLLSAALFSRGLRKHT